MTDAEVAGLIAGGSAVLGALVGAIGTLGSALLRVRQDRQRELLDRRLSAAAELLSVAREWLAEIEDFLNAATRRAANPAGPVTEEQLRDAYTKIRLRSEAHRRSRIELELIGTENIRRWVEDLAVPAANGLAALIMERRPLDGPVKVPDASVWTAFKRYRSVVDTGLHLFRHELSVPT